MKTFIIIVLSLALTAAAFFTRPSHESFKTLVRKQLQSDATTVADKLLVEAKAEVFANSFNYRDRYLWVTLERDGKTAYTGAFAHWFGSPEKLVSRAEEWVDAKAAQLEAKVGELANRKN